MKRTWIIGGLIVLVIGGGALWAWKRHQRSLVANAESATTFHGERDQTVLELLKQHATVETMRDPALGEYVTSINGVKSGTDGKYWIYFVNHQPIATPVDQYRPATSDTVEWKLQ